MFTGNGSSVVDAPVKGEGSKAGPTRRGAGSPAGPRRELADDYARRSRVAAAAARRPDVEDEAEAAYVPRRFGGLRFRLRGGVPRSWAGRMFAGGLVLASLGGVAAVLWEARTLLLHDPRLVLASSSAVEISGNQHVTRAQMLSIFGEDVDRNLLTVPMAQRRAELEAMPWVEHATVMRLLPDHVRVAIVERRPVAFVREGSHIGLVDAQGVLLDMAPDASADDHYSFPVLTGLNAEDPLSTRAARMHLYGRFTRDLDAEGGGISKTLSEVDLTSPEDVKALVPVDGSAILVHFGQNDFLARYQRFEANLPGWKTQYPRLASVDMRYDRQVVLEMAKGAVVPVVGAAAGSVSAASGAETTVAAKVVAAKADAPVKHEIKRKAAVNASMKKPGPGAKSAAPVRKSAAKTVEVKTKTPAKAAAKNAAVADEPAWEQRLNGAKPQHLEQSFVVGTGAGHTATERQPR